MDFNSKIIKSIGLEGKPSDHKIAVAMSGGVDSSVTAALLHKAGYNVFGVSMHLYNEKIKVNNSKTCCAGIDLNDAKKVCDKLGIDHFILNYSSRFNDQVISDFTESYLRGETPIPCVKCNQTVKFVDMLNFSKKMGAVALATGHYIRRDVKDGKPSLYRANDLSKDQSYFLFATTFEQLSYLRFPLGDFTKSTIRDLANYFDLNVAEKPDSQDICFVPDGKYSNLVRKLRPESVQKGKIYHVDGSYLGEHNGIIDYTIGQRKGIRIGGRKEVTENDAKLYVISIDEKNNKIVVGPKKYLSCDEFSINECNWITDSDQNKFDALVKLRNTAKPVQVKIQTDLEQSSANVILKNPEFGISPGQAAVFYDPVDENRVLGGGWIKNTKNYLND